MKEQQPIGITELQQKIERVDGALVKANRVIHTIGTPEFGRPELDISPSSQLNGNAYLDAAIRVGRVRKALTENAMPKLNDSKVETQAKINDLRAQNEREKKLQQVRELVDAEYLPSDVIEMAQRNLSAQKEVEKTKLNDENLLPEITILPDGKVRLSDGREIGGKNGELLRLLANTSEQNPKKQDQLVEELGLLVKGSYIGRRDNLYQFLSRARGALRGSSLSLVTLLPLEEEGVHGKRASYYLKSEEPVTTDGTATETGPKETSFRKSRMLKVEETLGIDITKYLIEEYEVKGRLLKDIATDITGKTNGQIRINHDDLYRWSYTNGINIIRRGHYMKDPLRRKAVLAKQMEKMQLAVQKRSDAELAILKAKFGENPKEALENLYVTQGISIKRIAETCSLSEYILKKWFKRFEIPQKESRLKPEWIEIFTRARLSNCITILSPKERQVLEDRYDRGKTLKEIGTEFGIKKEQVKYILSKALFQLMRQLRSAQSPKS